MTTSRLNGILHQLREELATGPSDGQLLEGFLSRRDEGAFAALVRRHGPMVLGVCRRLLKNGHDAEDAFQATFLVLVRKAASIRPRELVGHWLYGVAYRTALKAKTLAVKRRVKERSMPPPATQHEEPLADWLPLLDEELQRLPDKYRLPLVLCDLDGKTRKEAARQLGWPNGTLSTRLTRARVLLAERLTRRGVTLAGGAAALMILHSTASAQVPATLTAATVKAALGFAAGSTATAVSASVAALTQGVLKTMLLSKLKLVATLGLVLAFIGFGIGAGAYHTLAAEEPQASPPVVENPVMPPTPPIPPLSAKLPTRPMPALALVSLTPTGTVSVAQRFMYYRPETSKDAQGQQITRYRAIVQVSETQYSREDVKLYNADGKLLPLKEMPRLLKGEVTALVYADGKEPDPLHLQLFKEGTLFVVVSPPPPEAPRIPAIPAEVPPAPPPRSATQQLFEAPVGPQPPPIYRVIPFAVPTALPDAEEKPKLPVGYRELQGEWELVSRTYDGIKKNPPDEFKGFRMEIHHGNVLRVGYGPKYEQCAETKLLVFLDASSTPHDFDLQVTDGGIAQERTRGIYKLEGDELTICSEMALPGEKRPTDFTAPEGSKRVMMVYRRVTAKPDAPR